VPITVNAVYQGGMLRPAEPLQLEEGQAVQVTVSPLPDIEEVNRRLREAKSYQEWFEATKLLPSDDGGCDLIRALNENRKWST
jgi:predicted DNA-binding antitoxin AbrB/MazE fold protein